MSPQPPPSGISFNDLDDLIMEDNVDHDHEKARNCDDELDSVSHLFKTRRYSDIMHDLEVALQRESNDHDYQLIVNCNALSVDIDNEIVAIHNFIHDKYQLKFPELESIVRHAIDYAVRVDSTRGDPSGSAGRALRQDFHNKIEKWQEPPPAKLRKPLPVPDSEPKRKKRGGLRSRKMKERYAMTDMRKMANRMLFGVPEESYLGAGYGNGYGMLGQVGFGKLRLSVTRRKLSVAKKLSKGRR
ncbi:hypothetical protein Dsin_029778 [Dipteronia sinensis]|uniref:NOSIC domain-containing protein n=1 Tax=Dipteronia sinensis TaxID=43782 RepID=A0AAD9ZTC1_9ROSI|nr:hypothetical protein Dsin_029778 [Dipteronia sinensis]